MAINVVYGPDGQLLTDVAYQAGAGQYAQSQDRLALEEARLAQQGNQFQQELGLREQQLALQDMLNRRGLGAQMYQFNAERQDRAAAKEMDIAAAFQQELMRQQGFDSMRQSQQAMQTEELDARRQNMLTQEQMRTKQHFQDRQFTTAMAAAAQIEKEKATMTPEMYDQAREQWDQVYGEAAGEYPFLAPQTQQGPTPDDIEEIHQSLSKYGVFTKADAEAIARMPDAERIGFRTELLKVGANQEKAQQDMQLKQEEFNLQRESDKNKLTLESIAQENKIKMDSVNQQQLLEAQANQNRLKMAADMRNLQASLLKKELEILEEPTAADLERIRGKMQILQDEFDTEAAGITQPAASSGGTSEYSDDQVKSAKVGEVFYYQGRKVKKVNATTLQEVE